MAEVLEYDPLGVVMFRKVGTKAYWYVGPFATVTAGVSASCLGYGCSPVTTPKVGVHVLLVGTRIATVRAPPAGSTADPSGDVLYYHRDLRGSVIATTLSGGRVGVKYRYGPYGQLDREEVVDATGESELGYTGGLRLGWTPGSQSGSLLLLGARVYHAELRRWVQADTVEATRYTYAAGDPVNFVDPTGREARVTARRSGGFIYLTWYDEEGSVVRTDVLDTENPLEVDPHSGLGFSAWTPGAQYDFGTGVARGFGTVVDLRGFFPGATGAGGMIWNQAPPTREGGFSAAGARTQRPSWGALYRMHLARNLRENVVAAKWLGGTAFRFGKEMFSSGPVILLAGSGLSPALVEGAIMADILQATTGASSTGRFWGRVLAGGRLIEYRAFTLPSGRINVGTYYLVPVP